MTYTDSNRRPRVVILTAEGQPRPYNLDAIKARADVVVTDAAGLPEAARGADVLFLWDFFSSALGEAWPNADKLKWVHVAAAGVDAMMFDELRASEVAVTNAHGTFDTPIAEFVLASILAHDKQLHRSKELQQQSVWKHRELTRTGGSRVLVAGTGGIGRATARLLRAVGLEVRGVGRTARDNDGDFGTVVPSADLAEHAGWADHVVLIAPLTEQTRHMMNAEVLAAMKPTAHLINVGRGALVDEAALVEALRDGTIRGAGLDVFEEEPLPESSPLWDMPNVLVTPHISGVNPHYNRRVTELFRDNLARFLVGEPLRNLVIEERGY